MDFFTTLVGLAGQGVPEDRVIDGINLSSALINASSVGRWVEGLAVTSLFEIGLLLQG